MALEEELPNLAENKGQTCTHAGQGFLLIAGLIFNQPLQIFWIFSHVIFGKHEAGADGVQHLISKC